MAFSPKKLPRLGVNIDHIATLRQLRGTPYPSVLELAIEAQSAGADQITVHLREDRRHIQDDDVVVLKKKLKIPLNLEMAVSPQIVKFACKVKPQWTCLVPEKRQELTTEGGLNLEKNRIKIKAVIKKLQAKKIKVSLFIEPTVVAVRLAQSLGADAVELHTGKYCIETQKQKPSLKKVELEKKRIENAGREAFALGLGVHAGHGFDLENVRPVATWINSNGAPLFEEYNIGHALICRATSVGMSRAVKDFKSAILAP